MATVEQGLASQLRNIETTYGRSIDALHPASAASDPETSLYTGDRRALLPIHARLMAILNAFGDDVEVAPKKGYLSLRRRKQFAMIKPAAKHVDLGLILAERANEGRLESAATFNALFTHRVRVRSAAEVDDELIAWMRDAYEEAG